MEIKFCKIHCSIVYFFCYLGAKLLFMTRVFFLFFCLLLVTNSFLHAQTHFSQATIRYVDGTEQKKLVNTHVSILYDFCETKKHHSAATVREEAGKIREIDFELGSKFYYLTAENLKGEKEYGYFQVLLEGNLTLLEWKKRYFVKTKDGEILEISKSYQEVNGRKVTNFAGFSRLSKLMAAGDNYFQLMMEVEYKNARPDFLKVFKAFHENTAQPFIVFPRIARPMFYYGAQVLGYSSSMNNFEASQTLSFAPSRSLGIGIVADFYHPVLPKNLSLRMEANWTQMAFYEFFEVEGVENDLMIAQHMLSFPLLARWYMGNAYLEVGPQFSRTFARNYLWRSDIVSDGEFVVTEQEIPAMNGFSGFAAGIGYQFFMGSYPLQISARYNYLMHKETQPVSLSQMGLHLVWMRR